MESIYNATRAINPSLWEPTVRGFLGLPEEAFRGKEKLKLLASPNESQHDTSFPKGTRLGCYYGEEDDTELHWRGGTLGTVVQAARKTDAIEEILVTFLEDGFTTWIPSDWCSYQEPKTLWEAGPFLYNIWYNSYTSDPPYSEFHHVMQSLSEEFPEASPALFTYWQGKYAAEQEQEILDKTMFEREWIAVDPRLTAYMQQENPSVPIYHCLLRNHTIPVDDKYSLFKLSQADPNAASVFPPTFGSIKEALKASADDESDELFYLKDAGGSQGLGIRVLPRSEMLNEPEPWPGSIVVQRAVRDILTIDQPVGPLHRRRFDVRFFFVVHRGKVYLHSNMYSMWAGVEKPFDPNDPSVENQVPKVMQYEPGKERQKLRDFLFFPQASGTLWQTWAKPYERMLPLSSLDPASWREEISISLSKAKSTLEPLIRATASDPLSYHMVGADAIMEMSSGRAILMEYNDWPDYSFFNVGRERCLKQGLCSRRIVMPRNTSELDGTYVLTPPSADFYKVASGYTAQIIRDMTALVLGLESPEKLQRFREIKEWTETDICEGTTSTELDVIKPPGAVLNDKNASAESFLTCDHDFGHQKEDFALLSVKPAGAVLKDKSASAESFLTCDYDFVHQKEDFALPSVISCIDWPFVMGLGLLYAVLTVCKAGNEQKRQYWNNLMFLLVVIIYKRLWKASEGLFSFVPIWTTISQSFMAFAEVHPITSTSVVLCHCATYWASVNACFRAKTLRNVIFWWLVYEVVTSFSNEYFHFHETDDNIRCIRATFIQHVQQYAVEDMIRAYLLPPIFVYGYLLPKFCWHLILEPLDVLGFFLSIPVLDPHR